jgi:nucleoside-diphosphate-sugar epimerase
MLTHEWPSPRPPARVVVIGAAGFVGRAVVRNLGLRGVPVKAVARSDVDLLGPDAERRLVALLRPDDAVVAAAAIAPVKNGGMLRDNITLVQAIADALRSQPVAHLLNIGSDAIYADAPEPLEESSSAAPGTLHGIMHLAREVILAEAMNGRPLATLRPTLIYGADDPHNGYGPNRFRRLAAEGKDIVLFGEGEERRDHVLIDDVAELATRILMHRSRGILNAATGTVISFREAAERIVAQSPRAVAVKGSVRSGPMPHNGYRPFDPSATFAAFPDFRYTPPEEGFARVGAAATESA